MSIETHYRKFKILRGIDRQRRQIYVLSYKGAKAPIKSVQFKYLDLHDVSFLNLLLCYEGTRNQYLDHHKNP